MPDELVEAELLADVKRYLHINWQDEETDKNISSAIKSSKARLQEIAGVSNIDFTVDGLAKDLLKDRCRYINSQALEMFEKNFYGELLSLNIKGQVDQIPLTSNNKVIYNEN